MNENCEQCRNLDRELNKVNPEPPETEYDKGFIQGLRMGRWQMTNYFSRVVRETKEDRDKLRKELKGR